MNLPNRYIIRKGYRIGCFNGKTILNYTDYIWDCDLLIF